MESEAYFHLSSALGSDQGHPPGLGARASCSLLCPFIASYVDLGKF